MSIKWPETPAVQDPYDSYYTELGGSQWADTTPNSSFDSSSLESLAPRDVQGSASSKETVATKVEKRLQKTIHEKAFEVVEFYKKKNPGVSADKNYCLYVDVDTGVHSLPCQTLHMLMRKGTIIEDVDIEKLQVDQMTTPGFDRFVLILDIGILEFANTVSKYGDKEYCVYQMQIDFEYIEAELQFEIGSNKAAVWIDTFWDLGFYTQDGAENYIEWSESQMAKVSQEIKV